MFTLIKRFPMLLVTIILSLLFFNLNYNLNKQFKQVDYEHRDSINFTINLSKTTKIEDLSCLLYSGNYVSDEKDASFIAQQIVQKLNEGKELTRLYDLNTRVFQVPATFADSLYDEGLKERVENSIKMHGTGEISVIVKKDTLATFLNRFLHKDKQAVANVLVVLKEHYYDSLREAQDSVLGYAKTNKEGIAIFNRLDTARYYSVLPIRNGYEYGGAKGTVGGSLGAKNKGIRKFSFTQREHTVRLFDNLTFKQIRDDNALTVRTPSDFKGDLLKWFVLFFAAWWGLYFVLLCRKKKFDKGIIALLMLLTGFCLLTMFSIHNPLTDRMLGVSMAKAILSGIAVIGILQFVDFVKFFQNNSKIKFDFPFWPKGYGYLVTALFLTALLFTPFGMEVGGMKVNLNFGFTFQPSEIAKYLIVIFMATFFVKNADKIVKYSEAGNQSFFGSKIRTLLGILFGLGLLIGLYAVLGDMGPGLVLGVTFILLYSIIKSKVNLDKNLSEKTKWKRVFNCDFAMLIYGVISFAAFLTVGRQFSNMGIFCLLWFFCWIVLGIAGKKQIFESAIFMNLMIAAFIFGGTIFKNMGMESAGERFDTRIGMCVNTWGTLPLEGAEQKAGENNQVAAGLWGLASGGMTGQGFGEGNPNQIPAFHTDMILASIGEQMGWLGLLIVVVCIALLLRRTIVAGYKNGHPFAFYLATGIAIVTGVQFMIITLGSTGMIPLTGVTVPFLSFGGVSMILNLIAFGIVLSLSQKRGEVIEQQKKEMEKYNYTVAITSLSYCILATFVLLVFFNYQIFNRNETLIRPMFVNTAQGEPVIEYNPRITLLMRKLYAGNIYDRNGKILATNDKTTIKAGDYSSLGLDVNNILKKRTQRYYPFGDHLFFMIGDYNSGLLFGYNEDNPVGYLAEVQHLATLRSFNNIKYKDEKAVKVDLSSTEYRGNPFLYQIDRKREGIVLRDYSALTKMLAKGLNSREVEKYNAERKNRDITLTVDAALQTQMQNEIQQYVSENFKGEAWNKLRISVVVLNAKSGELLASANYPLPNQNLIKEKSDAGVKYYDDTKDGNFKAYTDRDLGLTYQTAPGSTAKVMSALAGLQKNTALSDKKYFIYYDEIIERKANGSSDDEPNKYNVTMEDAIVKSSNCYFINLVNDRDLYANLDSIYEAVGIRISNTTSYFLHYGKGKNEHFAYEIYANRRIALSSYSNYINKRDTVEIPPHIMSAGEWQWAWGQGTLSASPLNMARVVSIVANDGKMAKTKFILNESEENVPVVSKEAAHILKGYMQKESAKHNNGNNNFTSTMGGKTGTPERAMRYFDKKVEKIVYTDVDGKQNGKMNDGWYIFFIDSPKEKAPLAVAVRMERLGAGISGNAVGLTDKIVLETLSKMEYLNK